MNLPANLRRSNLNDGLDFFYLYLVQPIDSWSKDDVHRWFVYCIEEYSLGDIDLNDFAMNGMC